MTVSDLDIFLGKKIRLYRSKFNWSLKTLAEEIKISLQQLQRYELGENKIPATMLFTLATIFNVKINSFYEGFKDLANDLEDKKAHNILLIEDNANDEFFLRKALADSPESLNLYSIHNCSDALEFFRKLSANEATPFPKPSLIFLDLFIQHGHGFDVLRDIKRRHNLKDIPVIVITNSPNLDDIKKSYTLQASGFIRKSFDFNEFNSQLLKTLDYWNNTVLLP